MGAAMNAGSGNGGSTKTRAERSLEHPRVCTLQPMGQDGVLDPPCREPMTPVVVGVGDEGDEVYWYCEVHDRTIVPDWGPEWMPTT